MKIKSAALALLALLLLGLDVPLAAGHVVRSGRLYEPKSLDPARVWEDASSFYIGNIFETLVQVDPRNLKIAPLLAVGWKTSPDGRTWTFDLRRGVKFHDGTPFNADAVAFTFSRQMDPANPNRGKDFPLFAGIFPYLREVRKAGPFQVQFILSQPFYPFLSTLATDCAAVVSPAAVKGSGADFASQPVGTGPFKLDSWQKGKRLVLKANAGYWRGRPAIDEYIDTIEPQVEMLNKYFQEGKLDIMHFYSISKLASYKKQNWVAISTYPTLSVTYAVINAARPQLKSKGVRLALCHAWDPRTLKLVFQDLVLPIRSLLPPGLGDDAGGEPPIAFSLSKAQSLLRGEKASREIQLEALLLKDDGLLFQLFSLYANNLKQIGIKLKFTRLEEDALARRIAAGDFDLAYSGWIADYPDPDSMLFPILSEPLQEQGLANIAGCKRQDLQDLLIRARREGDTKKRLSLYREIDRALIADGLILPLYQDMRVIVYNRKLGSIQPNRLGRLYLFDLKIQ